MAWLHAWGCGGEPPPDPDAGLRDTLGIGADVPIHRITVGGRGGTEHVVPRRLRVAPGDVVQFVTVDGRPHTVTFLPDSVAPRRAEFMERNGQLASPPLVHRGSRFVVTFRDAPRGGYRFVSRGAGGATEGLIEVRPDPEPDS